jgi:hypothetical protein
MSNPQVEEPQAKKRKMSDEPIAPIESLLIKRLSEKAKIPTRGSALSAGYDLYRYADAFLNAKDASCLTIYD